MKTTPQTLIDQYRANGWWGDEKLCDWLDLAVSTRPRQWALIDQPERAIIAEGSPQRLTFEDLAEKVSALSCQFYAAGLRTNDIVIVHLPNIAELAITYFALDRLGVIVSPVPVQYDLFELKHVAGEVNPAAYISTSHLKGEAFAETRMPALEGVCPTLCFGQSVRNATSINLDDRGDHANWRAYTASLDRSADDILTICWTSGTTGQPKLARHSHLGQLLQCAGLDFLLGAQDPATTLLGVPMFHVGGTIASSLYSLSRGATIVTLHPNGLREPVVVRDFLANAERFGATSLGGVPASWSALLTLPSEHLDLSKVRHGIVAASTLPLEVARGVVEKFGFPLVEGWGMTETHCFATMNPLHGENRVGSVGLRFPYMQVRVAQLDDDGGFLRDCEVDEIGVLLVKGPQVINGYVDAAHNKESWVDGDWLNTGDLARQDGDGYFWHTGRAKDLIIRGGHNIDPLLIEEVLYRFPGIELAAAVGQPDRRVGEMPVAFVQMRAGESFDEDAIKGFVRERIQERAANPAAIHQVAEMPLTQVGKIFKPALRHEAARLILQWELSAIAKGQAEIEVTVEAHPAHGTLATITLTGSDNDLAASIREAAGGYPLHSQIIRNQI